MSRTGQLREHGDHATLTFRRVYTHAIEKVWDAIATPEGLAGWLLAEQAIIEGRFGGRIEMVSGPARYHSTGTILRREPPHVLEYEWTRARRVAADLSAAAQAPARGGDVDRLVRGVLERTARCARRLHGSQALQAALSPDQHPTPLVRWKI